MMIVAVDNLCERLTELEKNIEAAFPYDTIKSFVDPMLGAKYGVQHNVSIIIAERKMLRMNGFELTNVVHKFNKNVKIYLIKEANETFDGVGDGVGVAGWLERPTIREGLMEIASKLQA